MKKCLVVFPPQWSPFSPHLAPVTIAASIRKAGHKCDVRDLNLEFYRKVLTKDFLQEVVNRQLQSFPSLKEEVKSIIIPGKKPEDYSPEDSVKAKKLLFLDDIKKNKIEFNEKIISDVETAVKLLNDKSQFYNLKLAVNTIMIIDKALEIVSMDEFPQQFSLYSFKNRCVKCDWEHVLKYCTSDNIFSRFYMDKVSDIIDNNYDYIGISLSSASQFFSALTLAQMLKARVKNTKICIGGNYISRITQAVKNNPDFFKIFADYVLYEEGELATRELLEYLDEKRNIENVSSIIYIDKTGNVTENKKQEPEKLSELAMADLEGFNLEDYFLPEIIMPVQLSRGCYWKKCTFCDHYFGQTYNIKNIDTLIWELKTYKLKYGITNFEFTDDCISPAFLKEFSSKIIEEGLQINWYCDLRLENAFTQEILDLAYKAGLKMVLWGYEAGSKRVMELINKGIDTDARFDILKRAAKAGIHNFAYIFSGFPTETFDEAMQTVHDVCDNPDIVHSWGTGVFSLGRHSLINLNPEKFGITKIIDEEEFSSEIKFESNSCLKGDELQTIKEQLTQKSMIKQNSPGWMFLRYRELMFLYIVKYGRDKFLEMKYKINNEVKC